MRTEPFWILGLLLWCLFGLFSCHVRAGEPSIHGNGVALIVSIKDQKMALLRDGVPMATYPVSTSRFGTGDRYGSYATPLGKLLIRAKIGKGYRQGTVFNHRIPTGEILPPNAPGRDPIVTRILWLDGTEEQNRHAYARCIYIHGTPQENLLGRPVSYGCIRMRSRDVATLADDLPIGTEVQITEQHLPRKNCRAPAGISGLLASIL